MRLEVKGAGMMAYSWAVCLPEVLLPLQCRASDQVKGPGGSSIDSDSFQLTFTSLCHGGSEVKASACNAGDLDSIPGSGRFPQRRKQQPTPVFLPGEPHGQRSLVGYSPRGCKESDTTEGLHSLSLCHVILHLLYLTSRV